MVERPTHGSTQMSFILRFWLEEGGASGRFWRGRVGQADSDARAYVHDGAAILRFVRGKLLATTGVALPLGTIKKAES
jgi:hypothetical protein